MILNLITHTDIYYLLDQLIADYEKNKTTLGVFGQYTIAVPNKSFENWLSAQIVKRVGISSGIRFESLHSILHKIYRLSSENQAELVGKDQLAGLLFKKLSQLKEENEASSETLFIIKQWLTVQNQQHSLASLSHALADVFELYQIYRVDWLDAWAQHESVIGSDAEGWQSELWRFIVSSVPETTLLHRQQLTEAFETLVAQNHFSKALKGIQQLAIFGVNQVDVATLKQLQLVSQHIPVSLFWQSASRQLLGSTEEITNNKMCVERQDAYFSGNGLLASWGELSRQQFIAFERTQENSQPQVDDSSHSLLSRIKTQVLNNTVESDTLNTDLDKSISIASHFSCYREVEGLHDYLLELLNTNADLNTNDIIVLCPDINVYAAYINAVFDNQSSNKKIPFQVCGVSSQSSDLASVAFELISLVETRYTLSDVIDLLSHSYLRKRFELNADEVEQIHAWFKQANVYWGLDKTTLKQLNLPEYDRYTLQCGVDRMVLGLSLDGQSLMLDDEFIYGIEGISALDSATLSKLICFIDALRDWRDLCLTADGEQHSYHISDWCEHLRALTEAFIDVPQKEAVCLNSWYRLITDVEQSFISEGEPVVYSYAFIKSLIAQKIEDTSVSSATYRYGRVNLGSFGALKGIPAKVIALLGMNEADFPRKPKADSINLIFQNQCRLGDRNPVDQDKDAFLMAILNCQSHFYCSYIGNDMRSNNERIPSLPLQELLDFIQDEPDKQKKLIQNHPMKPYSKAYFQANNDSNNGLFTYQDFTVKTSLLDASINQLSDLDVLPQWEMPEQLTIQALKNFLEDPAKAFFKARFNVDLPSLDDEASDDEPMSANALTRWQFIDELLQLGLQQGGILDELVTEVGESYKASGLMEHDHFAESTLEDWSSIASGVIGNAFKVKGTKQPEMLSVDLALNVGGHAIQLVGDLNVFSDTSAASIIQLVHKKASDTSEKYLMRTFVDPRIAEALKLENKLNFQTTYLACQDKLYSLSADKQSGRSSLENWVGLYQSVMNAPVALDIISAGKIAQNKIGTEQSYRDVFEQMIEDSRGPYSYGGPSEAMQILNNDHDAVARGETYLDHYQYLKPGVKPTEDNQAPHWVEVKEGV